MSIVRNFNLYLNAGNGSAPYINVNQYDQGEQWVFTLYKEDGTKYTPSTGAIVGIKADNRGIINTGTVDADGHVVINETQQMTAAAGIAIFELLIDGDSHGTANFLVNVEQRPGDNADLSDSDLSLIQEAIDSAEVIVEVIGDGDPSEVIGEHVDAWLDNHPEATTTVEDGAITIPKLNSEVTNGTFENMTVGTAQAVLNDEGIEDKIPYKFRVTGGGKEVGNRALDTIVGGTVAWNQIYPTHTTYTVQSGDVSALSINVSNGYFNVVGIATADAQINIGPNTVDVPANHVCLILCDGWDGFAWRRSGFAPKNASYYMNKHSANFQGSARINTVSGTTYNIHARFSTYDLTQMFGSTIADYIYTLEQTTEGAGVAWFKKLFPKDYYEYNAGELKSVEELQSHDMVGFNQWDEEWELGTYNEATGAPNSDNQNIRSKNFIPVISGQNYYFTSPQNIVKLGYDADKNYIGKIGADTPNVVRTISEGCAYIKFYVYKAYGTTYNHDICINLSCDRNGKYEPYKKHSYPLDDSLVLRGIPKLDSSNNLYFDGDIYRHDGSVTRKYGIVDLGSLTWQYQSTWQSWYTDYISDINGTSTGTEIPKFISEKYLAMATNYGLTSDDRIGITTTVRASNGCRILVKNGSTATTPSGYLVYELATPITEQADPYQHVQIIDPNGTEEYVSTSIVPVGHITEYPTDIVAKVNALPKDFSTLIAPTEKTFTATRNYTVNDLLIINNVLYKVTVNIASGSTITPNSNVQQTTLSALIKALS